MKWIEEKVLQDEDYKDNRVEVIKTSEELIKKYKSNFKTQEELDYFRKMVNSYVTGRFDKSNGEGISNFLVRSGADRTGRGPSMYFDEEYDDFIKSLVNIHDQYLEKAIVCYDFASPEEIQMEKKRETQMYGSLIADLISNSENVITTNERVKIQHPTIYPKMDLIPHDRLFEYGKRTLRILSSKENIPFPRDMYEDLLTELRYREEELVRMSPDEYVAQKIGLLNESKIKHEEVKGIHQ